MSTRYTAQDTTVRTIAGGTVEITSDAANGETTVALTTAQAHTLMDQLRGNVPARITRPTHPAPAGSNAGEW